MSSWICRLLGHDMMKRSASQRVCLRCGQKEALRNLGHVEAWVEVGSPAIRVSDAP